MTYQIRVASANGYYHAMSKGNNRLVIFKKNRDRDKSMELLVKMVFSEVPYFQQFQGKTEEENLGKGIRSNKVLGEPINKTPLEEE